MRKAMLTRLLGVVLAALAVAVPLRAAEEAGEPQPHIVLIGISTYADKQIKPRDHAEDDAKALYDVFTDKNFLGADPKNVRLLLGTEDAKRHSQPATRENILKAAQWLATESKPNDLTVFAFFGEGGPLGDSGDRRCYFAADSSFKGRDKDAVAAADLSDAFKNLKSQRFCAFIDVDFKGFSDPPKGLGEVGLGNAPYQEFLGDDGSEEHLSTPGRIVFLATLGLSRSLDLEKHGIFAEAILAGLQGAADKEGYEPDGVVTVDELAEYLKKEIPELARKFGKTKEEKEQQHFVLGSHNTHFVLTHNPEQYAKTQDRLAKLAQMAKAGEVPGKFAEEGKNLLAQMPRLEAQRNLRKQYQALVDAKIKLPTFEEKRQEILDSTKMRRTEALDYARKVVEVTQLLKEAYVKDVNQGELVAGAIRGLYKHIEEKLPEDIEARLKKAKDLKESDLVVLLADMRVALGQREDLDKHKDLDYTLQEMTRKLDPYTTYIDPETVDRFRTDVQGVFTGIGIQIRKDAATDMLLVVTPIRNSPAYKAKLFTGDLITKIVREVDSKGNPLPQPEEIPTKGLALSDAVKKILGKPGTKVKLFVQRDGVDLKEPFEITRGRVEVESVHGIKRKSDSDDWEFMVDDANKIGYVRLSSFARDTHGDLEKAMEELVKRGCKGFVLDLRFNPGGLLDSAVNISDMFIEDGRIVSIRPRVGPEAKHNAHAKEKEREPLLKFPMVCLVNKGSASGSEIVSAALQDHKRALIVGERSYGKGSVQNIQTYDGGELKITIASFWRPSGRNLNKSSTGGKDDEDWGVTPDRLVKLSAKERDDLAEAQHKAEIIQRRDKPNTEKNDFKDRQLEEALDYLRVQIKTASRLPEKKSG
jgi:C-terminal peptidase prc